MISTSQSGFGINALVSRLSVVPKLCMGMTDKRFLKLLPFPGVHLFRVTAILENSWY
jgi:hypothetical protein